MVAINLQYLFFSFLWKSIFCVQQNREIHTGLGQLNDDKNDHFPLISIDGPNFNNFIIDNMLSSSLKLLSKGK